MVNKARNGYLPRQRETSCPKHGAGDDSRVDDWYCLSAEQFLLLCEGKGRLMGYQEFDELLHWCLEMRVKKYSCEVTYHVEKLTLSRVKIIV